jgi:hypothetical protein
MKRIFWHIAAKGWQLFHFPRRQCHINWMFSS